MVRRYREKEERRKEDWNEKERKGGIYNRRKTRRGVADHKAVCVKGGEVIKRSMKTSTRTRSCGKRVVGKKRRSGLSCGSQVQMKGREGKGWWER